MEVNASMNARPQSTIEPDTAPPALVPTPLQQVVTAALDAAQAPKPPTPLMDREQFKTWLGVSEWWVIQYTRREVDPLPWIGTARVRRIWEPDAIEWLRRNDGVTE